MTPRIQVLLVDDNPVIRIAYRAMLEAALDIDVVAEAVDGEEAVAHAALLEPDEVLVSFRRYTESEVPEGERMLDSHDAYVAFVLTQNGQVRIQRLGSADLIDEAVLDWLAAIGRADEGAAAKRARARLEPACACEPACAARPGNAPGSAPLATRPRKYPSIKTRRSRFWVLPARPRTPARRRSVR